MCRLGSGLVFRFGLEGGLRVGVTRVPVGRRVSGRACGANCHAEFEAPSAGVGLVLSVGMRFGLYSGHVGALVVPTVVRCYTFRPLAQGSCYVQG